MAEPSDRPAIDDGVGGRKKGVDVRKDEEMKEKRWEKKIYLIFPTRSGLFRPAGRSRHNEMKLVKSVRFNSCVVNRA